MLHVSLARVDRCTRAAKLLYDNYGPTAGRALALLLAEEFNGEFRPSFEFLGLFA